MTYTFDFDMEVARIKRDFPVETEHVSFIDADRPDAYKRMVEFDLRNSTPLGEPFYISLGLPRADMRFDEFAPFVNSAILDMMIASAKKLLEEKPNSAYRSFIGNQESYVSFSATACARRPMISDYNKECFYSIHHEAGHVIIDTGLNGGVPFVSEKSGEWENAAGKNLHEKTADTFSLGYGLHCGVLTSADVQEASDNRLWSALSLETTHVTCDAIDDLTKALKQQDFRAKAPSDVKDFARTAALRHMHTPADMEALHTAFNMILKTNQMPPLDPHVLRTLTGFQQYLNTRKTKMHLTDAQAILSQPDFCRAIRDHFAEISLRAPQGSRTSAYSARMLLAVSKGIAP